MNRWQHFRLTAAWMAAALWVFVGLWPVALGADGGTLRVSNVAVGDYRMSVFTDPTPMRPGAIDISVLVLDPSSAEVVHGLTVGVEATDGASALWRPVTREQADDPERYYSAKFDIPAPGDWVFTVTVDVPGDSEPIASATAQFEVAIREAGLLGNPLIVTGLLLLPLLGLAAWMLSGPKAADEPVAALALAMGLAVVAGCTPPQPCAPLRGSGRGVRR